MKQLDQVPFNIWDDYYDEGHVPKGQIQQTYGHVEEYRVLTPEEKGAIGILIINFLETLDLSGVEVSNGGEGHINFKHLTHKRRETLVQELRRSGLQFNGIPINFYSES